MVALTAGKPIKTRTGLDVALPVRGGVNIQAGAIVCMNGANAQNGAAALLLRTVGFALSPANNTGGADGAIQVSVRRGQPALLVNSLGGDALTNADINSVCYIVDDQTVAKTNGTNTRSAAGRVLEVTTEGVWVLLGEPAFPTT